MIQNIGINFVFCTIKNYDLSTDFQNFEHVFPPLDKFWADPQLVMYDDKSYVFFEEFSNIENKGWISFFTIDGNGHTKPQKIIEESHHLSYPHIFEFDQEFYMIPESSQKETIDLYKSEEFPLKWKFEKSLMKNVTAVDSTIFHFNKKWWLFSSMALTKGAPTADELFLILF